MNALNFGSVYIYILLNSPLIIRFGPSPLSAPNLTVLGNVYQHTGKHVQRVSFLVRVKHELSMLLNCYLAIRLVPLFARHQIAWQSQKVVYFFYTKININYLLYAVFDKIKNRLMSFNLVR